MERGFVRFLWRTGELGWPALRNSLAFARRRLVPDRLDVFKRNKAYLAGLEVDRIAICAETYLATRWPDCANQSCLSQLREHQRRGARVILLSGTLEPLALALAAQLQVTDVIATRCAQADGFYTAAAPLQHPFGPRKPGALEAYLQEENWAGQKTVAYGDSIHDVHLFEQVDLACCVAPNRRLQRLARRRNYSVLGSQL